MNTDYGKTGTACDHDWQYNAEGDRICRRCGREEINAKVPGGLRGASADPINTAMNVAPPGSELEREIVRHIPTEVLQRELDRRQAIRTTGLLTLTALREANMSRVNRWHGALGVNDWSVSEWAVAFAGEAGEACDAVKKLNRIEHKMANTSDIDTLDKAVEAIMFELADAITYADLLAARLGRPLAPYIQEKFNRVSEKYGFPERL